MLMNRRQLFLLAGVSWEACKARVSGVSPCLEVPTLQKKSFLVPKVDKNGRIASHEHGSASYFLDDLGDGVTLEMVAITGGTFNMGSTEKREEQPLHSVNVPSFFMGAFEVTRGQWRRVLKLPKVRQDLHRIFRLDLPEDVENSLPVDIVFLQDAQEFCARIANSTGRPYRIPSEAEWEYACRAGTTTAYHFGDSLSPEVAVKGVHFPEPAGSKNVPNEFGLHDMHGNVMEWCSDWWHPNYQGAPSNGTAWTGSGSSAYGVMRGGAYDWGDARSAARHSWFLETAFSGIGFRVALGPCSHLSLPSPRPSRRPRGD